MKIKSVIAVVTLAIGILFNQLAFADPVWIDVRTLQENKVNHIEGDILIPYNEIINGVSQLYPDKNTDIRLYCRSGRRASVALSSLKSAGYNNVKNVGSIDNARKVRAKIQ